MPSHPGSRGLVFHTLIAVCFLRVDCWMSPKIQPQRNGVSFRSCRTCVPVIHKRVTTISLRAMKEDEEVAVTTASVRAMGEDDQFTVTMQRYIPAVLAGATVFLLATPVLFPAIAEASYSVFDAVVGPSAATLAANQAFDPRTFQPVCGASDLVYRYLQSTVLTLVGRDSYEAYAVYINPKSY